MKVNRRTVLTTAAIVGVVALAAGGTIAYFTDKTDPITNTFTVGDIEVELYESQLHRQNSGYQGTLSALPSDPHYCDYTNFPQAGVNYNGLQANSYNNIRYCTPGMNADQTEGISAVINGHTRNEGYAQGNAKRNWGFSDQTIIDDDATYKAVKGEQGATEDGYFTAVSQNIVPGQWIRKFSYAKNVGTSDAYILIRYMVPTNVADYITVKVPGTPYEEDTSTKDGLQPYFTAVAKNATSGAYEAYELTLDSKGNPTIDLYDGYVETIGGVEYKVYAAVTTDVVNPDEMTFWSPVNTIKINDNVTETTVNTLNPQDSFGIVVDAQAIQAKTFDSAIDAVKVLLAE